MKAYELNQLASGIKTGDLVRVTQTASSYERGWQNTWESAMTDSVGLTFTVTDINSCAGISSGIYSYPYFVLEIVEKA